jgi:broad specificity phosphatase PhoE
MKIYILRHEDRTLDCSFFSPLTALGLSNANNLINFLEKLNINSILSSPFIRTLQTVYPFSNKGNIKINIEYGLSEIHHEDIIAKKSVGISLPEYLGDKYNYNCVYKSIIKHTDIKYPEKYIDVVKRVKIVLSYIIKKYAKTNTNILLVTHQSLCCSILEIINKCHTSKIDNHLMTNYPKGKICLVFENGWTFKPIN